MNPIHRYIQNKPSVALVGTPRTLATLIRAFGADVRVASIVTRLGRLT